MKMGTASESWSKWRVDPATGIASNLTATQMKASRVLARLGMWISFAFGVGVDLSLLHAIATKYGWGGGATVIADGIIVITLLLVLLERATYETENTKDTNGPIFLLSLIANCIVFAIAPIFLPILLAAHFLHVSKR